MGAERILMFCWYCCLSLAVFTGFSQETKELYVAVPGGKVYCKIIGLERSGTPLLLLHGGPGSGSRRLEEAFSQHLVDRPIIVYDQLGCGLSDRPQDTALWTVDRFVEELDLVIAALGYPKIHLLGHSWGGTLAAQYMIDKPSSTVVKLVLSSPLIDTRLWEQDAQRYIAAMPLEQQEALQWEHDTLEMRKKAYKDAVAAYYVLHVNRNPTIDAGNKGNNARSQAYSNSDIYTYMWGTNEFSPSGTLKDYSCLDRLEEIKVPTLYICGEHDEAAPGSMRIFHEKTPRSKLVVVSDASHSTYREQPAFYFANLREFLKD